MIRQNIANAQRKIEDARRAEAQRQQDKITAAVMRQSIQNYEATLSSVAALEGFDFDYRNTPRFNVPEHSYRPPASAAEAQQRLATLAKQIGETKRQLQSLGFDQRSDDFNRLGEISAEQMKEVKKQVTALGVGLAVAGGEEGLLKSVEKIKPEYIGATLRQLDHLGMKNTRLFHALKDFAGNAPRQRLAEDATVVVKFIEQGCDLKVKADKAYDGGRQEFGLALISLLTGNSIGEALHDGGDAGADSLYILSHNQKQLDSITDKQLGGLKQTTARMKRLVDERNLLRHDLPALQSPSPANEP